MTIIAYRTLVGHYEFSLNSQLMKITSLASFLLSETSVITNNFTDIYQKDKKNISLVNLNM